MFTKLEAERNNSSNYLLNTAEVEYDEFVERMQEIITDQQREIAHFASMRERAEREGRNLAATHYAQRHLEIHEKAMNNIDILDLAAEMRESVIFLMTGAVPSFIYVGRRRKEQHRQAKQDTRLIYG